MSDLSPEERKELSEIVDNKFNEFQKHSEEGANLYHSCKEKKVFNLENQQKIYDNLLTAKNALIARSKAMGELGAPETIKMDSELEKVLNQLESNLKGIDFGVPDLQESLKSQGYSVVVEPVETPAEQQLTYAGIAAAFILGSIGVYLGVKYAKKWIKKKFGQNQQTIVQATPVVQNNDPSQRPVINNNYYNRPYIDNRRII